MCHFPFIYQNVTYSSCAHGIRNGSNGEPWNLNGEPWCATRVDEDGLTVKRNKWSLCQDERSLILDGTGKCISYRMSETIVAILTLQLDHTH